MQTKTSALKRSEPYRHDSLIEQLVWLIQLRWLAIAGILVCTLTASYVFHAITLIRPVLVCTAILLLTNLMYHGLARWYGPWTRRRAILFGMAQIELDLCLLTLVLHFAGGMANPFVLFYVFHVIMAAMVLPLRLSMSVGFTAVILYGVLAVNALTQGRWLGSYPLNFPPSIELWQSPTYVLGAFMAFSCTIMLAQFLTRIVIARMTAKEMEAARNHELLRAVISAMDEGLIFIDRGGRLALCNPAAASWKTDDSCPDAPGLAHFPAALQQAVERIVQQQDCTSGQQVIKFEIQGREPRYIEAKGCVVKDVHQQPLGYVIVGMDVTEHRQLEQELTDRTDQVTAINEMLKMSRVQMAQREKMVAVGQMAAGIAHEIGNPLASLSSVVQYLARKTDVDQTRQHLSVMQRHINRISAILKRMLTFSRPSTAEYRWSDINELIENSLSLIQYDKRTRGVTVKNISNEQLPTVWLNPQGMEQILLNVFINALDAMHARTDGREKILEITRACESERVHIYVRDTGIGMSRDVAERAFESFFTTKDIGKGTGLGLFITHNLVTELDGTVRIESEPGRGTTVTIQVPVRPKAELFADQGPGTSTGGDPPVSNTIHARGQNTS